MGGLPTRVPALLGKPAVAPDPSIEVDRLLVKLALPGEEIVLNAFDVNASLAPFCSPGIVD